MPSRDRPAHDSPEGQNREYRFARTAHQLDPFDRGGGADGDDGGAVDPYRAQHDRGAFGRGARGGGPERPHPAPSPHRARRAHRFEAGIERCTTATGFQLPKDSTIRRTSTTHAASASWWT